MTTVTFSPTRAQREQPVVRRDRHRRDRCSMRRAAAHSRDAPAPRARARRHRVPAPGAIPASHHHDERRRCERDRGHRRPPREPPLSHAPRDRHCAPRAAPTPMRCRPPVWCAEAAHSPSRPFRARHPYARGNVAQRSRCARTTRTRACGNSPSSNACSSPSAGCSRIAPPLVGAASQRADESLLRTRQQRTYRCGRNPIAAAISRYETSVRSHHEQRRVPLREHCAACPARAPTPRPCTSRHRAPGAGSAAYR